MVAFSLIIAACLAVVVTGIVLLVVQPGNSSTYHPGTSVCFDSAMQMNMPCSLTK